MRFSIVIISILLSTGCVSAPNMNSQANDAVFPDTPRARMQQSGKSQVVGAAIVTAALSAPRDKISGRLVIANSLNVAPLGRMRVELFDKNNKRVDSVNPTSDGYFQLSRPLAPGKYKLQLTSAYYNAEKYLHVSRKSSHKNILLMARSKKQ